MGESPATGAARGAAPRGRHAPPLEVRQETQRQRLLDAAAAVFARSGYAEASAESVSREAGMSKATFYEHFANKEECILALFDAAAEALDRRHGRVGAGRRRGARGATARRHACVPGCRGGAPRTTRRRCSSRSSAPGPGPPSAATRSSPPSPRSSTPRTPAPPSAHGWPPFRLERRRVRDRRRDRRARLAPDPSRRARRRPRARAGDRADDRRRRSQSAGRE